VARDAAHRRMVEALDKNEPLPFDIKGQTIYYMGPAPAKPGQIIGSAGPTTSIRMDVFTPRLLEAGLRAMIGKGGRSPAVWETIKKHKAVYLVTTGGASALLARSVKKVEPVAYEDLGTEAIIRLTVEDFPAIVANDASGADLFEQGRAQYQRVRG
jgi:fumarate hydratase subunit beta